MDALAEGQVRVGLARDVEGLRPLVVDQPHRPLVGGAVGDAGRPGVVAEEAVVPLAGLVELAEIAPCGVQGKLHRRVVSEDRAKAEQAACRSFGMNLGITFQLVDDVLDYGGTAQKLGKNIGDDFREGKITLPVVLAFRRGAEAERAFWRRTLERGETNDVDLDHAIGLMTKHRALEDTLRRAQHYGAIARDALALFPDSPMKAALAETVDFCVARTH